MTKTQISWAADHDWFLLANADGSVTVMDYAINEDGLTVQHPVTFTDFELLQIWAGY